jgi:RNA methyltransferase, TrmH family
MISKAKIKFIKSLQVKKYRHEAQSFVVEGAKSVEELLKSEFDISLVVVSEALAIRWDKLLSKSNAGIEVANEAELTAMGSFQTNTSALAVAKIKPAQRPILQAIEFALVLDDVRDPGNLGTIIRTADWYGVRNIIVSEETADFYNPKVISASMGSFCRVNVFYTSLGEFLSSNMLPVYGTFLNGADIHKQQFAGGGLLVIGNEANGISSDVEKYVTHKITIPRLGKSESLNAGVATAIVLDNVMRLKK